MALEVGGRADKGGNQYENALKLCKSNRFALGAVTQWFPGRYLFLVFC